MPLLTLIVKSVVDTDAAVSALKSSDEVVTFTSSPPRTSTLSATLTVTSLLVSRVPSAANTSTTPELRTRMSSADTSSVSPMFNVASADVTVTRSPADSVVSRNDACSASLVVMSKWSPARTDIVSDTSISASGAVAVSRLLTARLAVCAIRSTAPSTLISADAAATSRASPTDSDVFPTTDRSMSPAAHSALPEVVTTTDSLVKEAAPVIASIEVAAVSSKELPETVRMEPAATSNSPRTFAAALSLLNAACWATDISTSEARARITGVVKVMLLRAVKSADSRACSEKKRVSSSKRRRADIAIVSA